MNQKLLTAGAIIASLFGYLEWGQDNQAFLFQAEWEILTKLFTNFSDVAHPFTLIPLFGQIVLLITLFQKLPTRWMSLAGVACISVLFLFMFFIGVLGFNIKIILSTLPYLILAFLVIRNK